MIDFDFSKHCCGCGACSDVCPRRCITIVEDSKDFRVPKVSIEDCIQCGLCEKVCPVLNNDSPKGLERLLCCFNINKEQRKEGSSGSVFILLAEEVIRVGGVVIGASFDDGLQLRHQVACTMDEVRPLMKSKYIQSDTSGIYVKVRKFLNENRWVLFVGSPCQCHALYNFLGGKNPERLLLVDFICHGVPSQRLFDKAIRSFENRRNCKVQSFRFREKAKGQLHCYSICYTYNGESDLEMDIGTANEFPFYNGYLRYNTFRESCYECRFAHRERVSDITLGDFWGINEVKKGISDFRKGYSMLIVNSSKAELFLKKIASKIEQEEFPIELAEKYNYAYTHATKKGLLHKRFIKDYNVKPYEVIEKQYLQAPVGLKQELRAFIYRVISQIVPIH